MTLEKRLAKFFNLEGDNWLKHANPWSIWTRFATLPFIIVAVWSRVWYGWYCLIPIAILIIWIIVNPTLFKKPKSYNNWGSKSVLGERYWSNRKKVPVPQHHHPVVLILTILQTVAGIILMVGLWKLKANLVVFGATSVYLTKMWFLDRMVWITEDMKEKHPIDGIEL